MLTFSRTRKTLNFLADQVLTPNQDLGIKVATPAGTVFGQLIFGWLADVFGRKRMCESTASILVRCPYLLYALHEDGIEMMLIIVASFGQAMCGQAQAANIIGVLVVWRVVLGVGIGGDYPLSSVIPSEFASTNIRGRMMVVVGANQGWGQFSTSLFRLSVMLLGLTFVFVSGAAALVAFIIIEAFKSSLLSDDPANLVHVDFMWRLLIGLGCVPGAVALYFRLTIPETPRFTMDVERNVRQASQDVENFLTTGSYYVDSDAVVERVRAPKATKRDFMRFFSRKENLVPLIGMCYSWFAIDVSVVSIIPRPPVTAMDVLQVAFYGLGLNTSIILQAIGFGTPSADLVGTARVYQNLKNIAVGNMILSAAGLIPGFWVSFLLVDSWGRKPVQLLGFTMLSILYVIMGTFLPLCQNERIDNLSRWRRIRI